MKLPLVVLLSAARTTPCFPFVSLKVLARIVVPVLISPFLSLVQSILSMVA